MKYGFKLRFKYLEKNLDQEIEERKKQRIRYPQD
jgi:hypothetical protein